MTLNRLHIFLTVAQTLNFSQAAKRHFISQTAVSQHIKALEEELGILLLERTRHSVRLTPAGRVYYEYTVQALSLLNTAEEKARLIAASEAHTLNIDIMPGLENSFFVDLLMDYKNQEPAISYHFHRSNRDTIRQKLPQGKTDLALILELYPFAPDMLYTVEIARVQNYVIINQNSPLASFNTLTARQLKSEQFYMVASHFSHDWTRLTQNLQRPDTSAEHTVFVDDLDELLLQITFHNGFTVLAEPILRRVHSMKSLVAVPLEGDLVPVCMVWRKNHENPALRNLLAYMGKMGIRVNTLE